ncbi:hypothetical protein ElyMa_001642900 [Elysia marginata]|uniref:SWIM-type domain-containing protein n=1 Tax=Elysia marginata TaxID=1093978 RepID=A0AAV4JPD1_9GAST|nr:hypothetical protein ElyMa_001642900 [Elysia marginata]
MSLRSKVYRPQFDTARDLISAAYATFTPYACKMLKQELDKLHKQVVAYDAETKTLAVSRGDGEQIIYPVGEGCTCLHFVEKQLPCWHMLGFYQAENNSPLNQVPERYRKDRMMECVLSEIENGGVQTEECCVTGQVTVVGRKREKSEWEKRTIMKETCRELV